MDAKLVAPCLSMTESEEFTAEMPKKDNISKGTLAEKD